MNDFQTIEESGLLKNYYDEEKDKYGKALKKKRETMSKNRGITEEADDGL